jgi:hypothetical protein
LLKSAGSSGQWPGGIFRRIPRSGYGVGTAFSSVPGIQGRTGPKVRTILLSFTLLFTVTSSVFLGVISAYGAIHGILQIFAQHPQAQPQEESLQESLPALVAQEAVQQ